MTPFTRLTAIAAPLPLANLDTDAIIPKQFLKTIRRTGLGRYLFHELRTTPDGAENPAFILNREPWRRAQILLAGANFGCGSSREHAPWALADFGFRCVIAPGYADIFFNNCFKNGILPVILPQENLDRLVAQAETTPELELTVDLETQTVAAPDGTTFSFTVEPFLRHCLLNGLDDIGLTEQHESAITAFETRHKAMHPWVFPMEAS